MGFWDALDNLGASVLDSAGKLIDSVASGVGSGLVKEKDKESKAINTDATNKGNFSGPDASGIINWVSGNATMLLVAAVGITGLVVLYKKL